MQEENRVQTLHLDKLPSKQIPNCYCPCSRVQKPSNKRKNNCTSFFDAKNSAGHFACRLEDGLNFRRFFFIKPGLLFWCIRWWSVFGVITAFLPTANGQIDFQRRGGWVRRSLSRQYLCYRVFCKRLPPFQLAPLNYLSPRWDYE